MNFTASTVMDFKPEKENESAGMALIQSNEYPIRFECTRKGNSGRIRLIRCIGGREEIAAEKVFSCSPIHLKVIARGQEYSFYFGAEREMISVYPIFDVKENGLDVKGFAGG